MMWTAFDCGIRAVRNHGLDGPADQWEHLRERLREEVLREGFNPSFNSFTQAYGGNQTDAALLVMPQVGFLPYDVEQYARTGRRLAAKNLMDKLVGFANELGLLSEEYATKEMRMAGNFPQAFSHLALVRAAEAMHGVDLLSMIPASGHEAVPPCAHRHP